MNVIDRRDLERLLGALVHSEHRDDIRVDVLYLVKFSTIQDAEGFVQCVVDPHLEFPRARARVIVGEAISTLDKQIVATQGDAQKIRVSDAVRKELDSFQAQGEPNTPQSSAKSVGESHNDPIIL